MGKRRRPGPDVYRHGKRAVAQALPIQTAGLGQCPHPSRYSVEFVEKGCEGGRYSNGGISRASTRVTARGARTVVAVVTSRRSLARTVGGDERVSVRAARGLAAMSQRGTCPPLSCVVFCISEWSNASRCHTLSDRSTVLPTRAKRAQLGDSPASVLYILQGVLAQCGQVPTSTVEANRYCLSWWHAIVALPRNSLVGWHTAMQTERWSSPSALPKS